MNRVWGIIAVVSAGITGFGMLTAHAQFTYPGCEAITASSFKHEIVVQRGMEPDPTLQEPIQMALDMGASGAIDVYYVERRGKLKLYSGATKSLTVLGTLDVFTEVEMGLTGLALDPRFKTNRWIYLFYAPKTVPAPAELAHLKNPGVFRLSRFTLTSGASPSLDMASEKKLLEIPVQRETCCHTGGQMAFDDYGDLWISTGNNAGRPKTPPVLDEAVQVNSDEWGSTSTANLRGGILRIRPDYSARGYSIPPGNYGDYFGAAAAREGKTQLAAQYRDTALVKPEIYVKGTRNPYSLNVDPVRRWVMWGDVGHDGQVSAAGDEYNLFKTPGFAGWPYFVGSANAPFAGGKDPAAPTNTSKWNRGMQTLPPAIPALYAQGRGSVIGGPIYRYDGDLQSTVKFPPHFHRKWFVSNWGGNKMPRVYSLDSSGGSILKREDFPTEGMAGHLDLEFAPDGSLYVINYGTAYFDATSQTSISRFLYTGTCRPNEPKLERVASSAVRPGSGPRLRAGGLLVSYPAVIRLPEGKTGVELYDLGGGLLWKSGASRPGATVEVPRQFRQGLWIIRHTANGGR